MSRIRCAVLLAVCLGWPACTSDKPDASTPWVVVLDEAATRSKAAQLAGKLRESHPQLLEDAATLSFLDKTTVRHLVVSPGLADRNKAEDLADKLVKSKPGRLPVIDTTSLKTVKEEEDFGSGAPEDAEALEKLASLLPEPLELEVESFILWITPEKTSQTPLRPFGHGCPGRWWRDFRDLGWQSSAQAVYRSGAPDGSKPGPARIYLFIGRTEQPTGDESLKKVYNHLLQFVGPSEEEWEQINKKKSRRRRRRNRRSRRSRKPKADIELTIQDLPAKKPYLLPWGSVQAVMLERVTFLKKDRIKQDTPVFQALLGPLPGGRGVILVLYDSQQSGKVQNLLLPRSLGEPHGLAYSPLIGGFWKVLPEVSLEEENLSYLGMQRFVRRFDRKRRRNKLVQTLADKPVYLAGYRSKGRPLWQISWADLGNPALAEKLYDSAYVEPRKELIQRLLNSRRKVHYDLGVSFKEIGDALGWHLRGAQNGYLQELYFQRKGVIWLLQALERGPARMDPDGLQARTELLQIWDPAAENP